MLNDRTDRHRDTAARMVSATMGTLCAMTMSNASVYIITKIPQLEPSDCVGRSWINTGDGFDVDNVEEQPPTTRKTLQAMMVIIMQGLKATHLNELYDGLVHYSAFVLRILEGKQSTGNKRGETIEVSSLYGISDSMDGIDDYGIPGNLLLVETAKV